MAGEYGPIQRWQGGACPVEPEQMVRVVQRGYEVGTYIARHVRWGNAWRSDDIVAYQIVEGLAQGESED